ncbi:ABC-type transport auxiliary lipoprotein family protein [Erythrobacter crassostreae]|uniref:Membrane integrity-associated transporter subunit PqiC n=1 Tax=Erythrobacter crassostreae TaxID=2828328 RepID=A0A9X1F2Z9_9SPHN|nr:ABC-type transport auxiliary lipoprotein family protein [Erythrobacter crassostrea]MBV7259214.1 membrane integrity-associated transporter subunit PqiC [Erythrobacter crassostrea]
MLNRITLAPIRTGLIGAAALALSGCVSFEADLPTSLLTLQSTANAPVGSGAQAGGEGGAGSIAVLTPETPAKLDVVRVPVNVSQTEIAYLQDAVWVEKPARLFRRLLGETLRTRSPALIVDSDDTPTLAAKTVRGTLLEMGYDASASSVIIRYEAIVTDADGKAVSRRFEGRESGVLPESGSVGPALNRVANTVAGEVADWVVAGA